MTSASGIDTGTGYGRKRPIHDAQLTEVGPGTPMGEAMRRYWHPIAVSSALTNDVPHRTRVLGENLIVFRDGKGRAGVVFERCAHRGSSLYYGRIEDDGIRCCYHGWKYDVQGHCLEQACEPSGGRRRDLGRQPWYPVEERYGLVFVYMGPPDRKPALPRYDCMEPLEEGDQYFAEMPGPVSNVTGMPQDFNWLQIWENAIDPVHAAWLHYEHSGPQFGGTGTTGFPVDYYDPYTASQKITYYKTALGAKYHQRFQKPAADGTPVTLDWVVELLLPNMIALPDFVNVDAGKRHDCILWVVPSDDTTHRFFFCMRAKSPDRLRGFLGAIKQNGKDPWLLTEEERQRFPGDAEAQGSQGPITQHSEETLVSSDRGVLMVRRMLKQMVSDVEAGRDPQTVSLTDGPPRHVESGVFVVSPADLE